MKASALLADLGYSQAQESTVQQSLHRFPDGADFRIEIPSVEDPAILRAVLNAARDYEVTVNRVSQGSGAALLRDSQLEEFAGLGAEFGLEVSLFVGPRGGWDTGAHARSADGAAHFGQLRGLRQLLYATEDVLRAVEFGIRSFLVADLGHLTILTALQRKSEIPMDVVWKISVLAGGANPASLRVLQELGATTMNVPSDVTIEHLAEMRASVKLPIDLYVESPDSLGGVVRGLEIGDLVRVAAPLYAKFGLRNSRNLYPFGEHLSAEAQAIAREKVRRAAVATDWLKRLSPGLVQSKSHAKGLGIPAVGAGQPTR